MHHSRLTFSVSFSILLALIFWMISPAFLFAQTPLEQAGRVSITTYMPEDYKGHAQVWAAAQSNDGLMYFGTSEGILEYDGDSWRQVLGEDVSDLVRALGKGPSGKVFYAGRESFGYLNVEPKGETQAVSLFQLIPEEFRTSVVFWNIHFLEDYIFLRSKDQFFRLELGEALSLKSLKVWSAETVFSSSFLVQNTIYIHQPSRGVYKLSGEEIVLIPDSEILGKDPCQVLLPYQFDGESGFLLGGLTAGFYFLNSTGLRRLPTQIDADLKEGALLYKGHQLENGNYLFTTLGAGIFILNSKGEIIRRINTDQGLQSDIVLETFVDQTGVLWIMTENGIARSEVTPTVLTYSKDAGVGSKVTAIQKVGEEIYLGTSQGLLKFDSLDRVFHPVPGINKEQILNLQINGNELIVPGNQLQVLKNGKVVRLDGAKNGSSPRVTFIPRDNPNVLFVGTTTGLSLYRIGLTEKQPWEFIGEIPGINREISSLFETKDGKFWAYGFGFLFQFSQQENKPDPTDINSYKIKSFEIPAQDFFGNINGKIYRASAEGMLKYSTDEGKFISTKNFETVEQRITTLYQITNNQVIMQAADDWVLLKRQPDGNYIEDPTPSAIGSYISPVKFMDSDSIIWFGSTKGLIRFDPKKDVHADKPFFTLIRRVGTKGDTLGLSQYGRNKDLKTNVIEDNSLRFVFTAPYFEDEKKTKYQTYLVGFEEDWVAWTDNNFKEYTNLSPGLYTFRVRAKSLTGKISEEAVYSFKVLPPWYATWWAYLGYTLLLVLLIVVIVKWRSQKLKAENRILEERVRERTAQLEKSLTELKSTQAQLIQSEKMASLGQLTAGIAHEIQNPLNFVNNFSEVSTELLEEIEEERAKSQDARDETLVSEILGDIKQNLEKISHHGKRADAIVKGMLEHSRTGSGVKELTNVNTLAKEFLNLAYQSFKSKNKEVEFSLVTDFDSSLLKTELVRADIGKVLLNILNNAFYACTERKGDLPGFQNPAGLPPTVILTTKNLGDKIEISIKDNGPGIPDSIKDKIFQPFFTTKPTGQGTGLGLSLSYDIVKSHGGELKVVSKEGEGSEFIIQLPIV